MARSVIGKTAVTIGMALGFTAGGATAAHPDELTRQLQITDGAEVLSSREGLRQHEEGASGRAGPAGDDGKEGSRVSDWFFEQLQISDGYDPVRERQLSRQALGAKGPAGPSDAKAKEGSRMSDWFAEQLQISDGYDPVRERQLSGQAAGTKGRAAGPHGAERTGAEDAAAAWLQRELRRSDGNP